jgi:hypothetical protein
MNSRGAFGDLAPLTSSTLSHKSRPHAPPEPPRVLKDAQRAPRVAGGRSWLVFNGGAGLFDAARRQPQGDSSATLQRAYGRSTSPSPTPSATTGAHSSNRVCEASASIITVLVLRRPRSTNAVFLIDVRSDRVLARGKRGTLRAKPRSRRGSFPAYRDAVASIQTAGQAPHGHRDRVRVSKCGGAPDQDRPLAGVLAWRGDLFQLARAARFVNR